MPRYTWLRDTTVGWLRALGILRGTVITVNGNALPPSCDVIDQNLNRFSESGQARASYNDAESKYNSAKERKRNDEDELAQLFDPDGFGAEGEWKKLQGLCLSKDTGE